MVLYLASTSGNTNMWLSESYGIQLLMCANLREFCPMTTAERSQLELDMGELDHVNFKDKMHKIFSFDCT